MGIEEDRGSERVEWRTSAEPVDYPAAVAAMEARVAAIRAGTAGELVWLVEHPPLYSGGTSASDDELLDRQRLPAYRSARGGRWTYHGPGQRVAYVMLDLARRRLDVHCFVHYLEDWGIAVLARFGVEGERRTGRVGIWVRECQTESKIAAIGVRVRRGVTYHGIAFNLDPDLGHYRGIVPCGIADYGVTSLRALGKSAPIAEFDGALFEAFAAAFDRPIACR